MCTLAEHYIYLPDPTVRNTSGDSSWTSAFPDLYQWPLWVDSEPSFILCWRHDPWCHWQVAGFKLCQPSVSGDLDRAANWADRWGMLFSTPKSKHLPIGREAQQSPSVFMKGAPISQVRTHKHLGLIFNSSLTWNDHISNLYTTCARMTGILRRLDGSIPSSSMKKKLYSCHSPPHRICLRGMEWRTDSKTPTITRLIFEKTWNNASSPPEEIQLRHPCASLQNTWKVSSRSFVLITSLPHIEHIWLFSQKALLTCPLYKKICHSQ